MSRLVGMGCTPREVRYRVTGGTDEQGHPSLLLDIAGTFDLVCQRCLKPMTWALSTIVELELVAGIDEIELAEDDRDRVVATKAMDVESMVEDEIILEVPMIPRHESCSVSKVTDAQSSTSQFSALSVLKRGRLRSGDG